MHASKVEEFPLKPSVLLLATEPRTTQLAFTAMPVPPLDEAEQSVTVLEWLVLIPSSVLMLAMQRTNAQLEAPKKPWPLFSWA